MGGVGGGVLGLAGVVPGGVEGLGRGLGGLFSICFEREEENEFFHFSLPSFVFPWKIKNTLSLSRSLSLARSRSLSHSERERERERARERASEREFLFSLSLLSLTTHLCVRSLAVRLGLLEDLSGLGLGLRVRSRSVVSPALGEVRRAGLDVVEQRLDSVRARRPDRHRGLGLVDEDEEPLVAEGEGDAARGLAHGVAAVVVFGCGWGGGFVLREKES